MEQTVPQRRISFEVSSSHKRVVVDFSHRKLSENSVCSSSSCDEDDDALKVHSVQHVEDDERFVPKHHWFLSGVEIFSG